MRISGVVSISRLPPGNDMSTLGRVRWFLGSLEVQTWQSQPIMGTPVDVPVPRKVNRRVPAASVSIKRLALKWSIRCSWSRRFGPGRRYFGEDDSCIHFAQRDMTVDRLE